MSQHVLFASGGRTTLLQELSIGDLGRDPDSVITGGQVPGDRVERSQVEGIVSSERKPKALPHRDWHLRAVRSNPAMSRVAAAGLSARVRAGSRGTWVGAQEPASLPPRGWGDRPSPTIVAFTIVNSNNPVT
ncbi:unnamed protein product [Rangifer tarandus platyrhynchus]|uniref:Uncharacterized protein n=1 Tax=Rangifer tarandus platyrhynchus TaxID=3082113 RepID=A0AC59YWM2_RANTA